MILMERIKQFDALIQELSSRLNLVIAKNGMMTDEGKGHGTLLCIR